MKNSKRRRELKRLKDQRQLLVNKYNTALHDYGADHVKTRYHQRKLIEFDSGLAT